MQLADLLRETLNVDCDEVWANEHTSTPDRVFGVRLHSMGLSLREVIAVLDLLGVDRSHGAIWNWTHTLAETQRDPPTASSSETEGFLVTAFLHRLTEKHDLTPNFWTMLLAT